MSSQLHERLIASSEANERSLSEEIERRLESSFTDYDVFIKMLGGQNNSKLLITIASAWSMIEALSDKKWNEDQDVFNSMKIAAKNVLEMVKVTNKDNTALESSNYGLSALGENMYKQNTIDNFGLSAAAYAVSIAKQIEVTDKVKEFLLSSAYEFDSRTRADKPNVACPERKDQI